MKHFGLLAVLVGIATVSYSLGQVKKGATQVTDAMLSDHDKIEKLRIEVAELQDKLVALTQKYEVGVRRPVHEVRCSSEFKHQATPAISFS